MIEGVKTNMGGIEWVVPPLNIRQIRTLGPKLAELGGLSAAATAEQLDIIVEVVQRALTRNYPDVTIEQVEEMLDLGNANDIILAIMGLSGLASKGEAQAGSQSTGGISTGASPPSPGGHTAPSTT
jgi:hypothetical protein